MVGLKLLTTLSGWWLPSVVGDQPFFNGPAQLHGGAIPPKDNQASKKDSHHTQGIVTIRRYGGHWLHYLHENANFYFHSAWVFVKYIGLKIIKELR